MVSQSLEHDAQPSYRGQYKDKGADRSRRLKKIGIALFRAGRGKQRTHNVYPRTFLRSARLITLVSGSRSVKSKSASAFTSRPVRLTSAE